jgi:hypothetical protein
VIPRSQGVEYKAKFVTQVTSSAIVLGALFVIQFAPLPGNAAEVVSGRVYVKKTDCPPDDCAITWSVRNATDVYSEPSTQSTRKAVLEPSTSVRSMGGEMHLIPGEAKIVAKPYRTAVDLNRRETVYILEYEGDGRSRIYQKGRFYTSKIARTKAECEGASEPDPRYCWVEVLREPTTKELWLKVEIPDVQGVGWILGGRGNIVRID